MKAEVKVSRAALQHGAWLAVCDGARALLLENKGERSCPKLETREFMANSAPPTHELGTAKPGRAFSGIDGRRSAVEDTDFHLQAEQKFLQTFAEHIEHKMHDTDVPALVLIAPARAMGFLREHLGACTRRVLAGTIARDYVHLPLYEIERHLTELQENE
jgi:protein required for attachment to host cells